jgi:para-aminobenzoate synthetase component 1
VIAREIESRRADELARRLAHREGFVWLDGDGSAQGLRSYLAIEPSAWIVAHPGESDALGVLAALTHDAGPHGHVPRYIGFIGYDAARTEPPRLERTSTRPLLRFGRYDAVVEIDHATGRTTLVGEPEAVDALAHAVAAPDRTPHARAGEVHAEPSAVHADAIREALRAIAAGDVYEVNLARRLEAPYEGDPLALFLAMREASPVPFGAFIGGPDFAIASRSMERFLEWTRSTGRLSTRPIKGTIARSEQDDAEGLAQTLRDDAKERAEHVMIVDLMRNDLGRVAEVGSVAVESLFEVEPYAKLSHLVSTVACRTRPEVGVLEILRATFPPGSVTGAPKVTAIRTIEALERYPRGPYTGAIGFVSRAGDLSLSVAIRTAVIADGVATYFAGGGIVEASDPDREVAETDLKAKVFTDAIARSRWT